MQLALKKSIKMYLDSFGIIAGFSIFALCSLILIPLIASYIDLGSGFIRYSSLYLDINTVQATVFLFVGIISLLFMAFFMSSIITTVKLKETLDHVGFTKVLHSFYSYVLRIFSLLVFLGIATAGIGVLFTYLQLPNAALQLIIFAIWLPFIFVPQIVILDDFSITKAIKDSFNFIVNNPKPTLFYFIVGFALMLILAVIEVLLGHLFIWEHKLITIFLLSLGVLPFMLIFTTELYLSRYPLSHTKSV
ncbi:hypothetical protein DRN74_01760 [Candidatus Micrarchaeota archaeon]|nr:MAG: hypothetical protein DRN74_01760 [Candidatus Micrarchaeota archaeon]